MIPEICYICRHRHFSRCSFYKKDCVDQVEGNTSAYECPIVVEDPRWELKGKQMRSSLKEKHKNEMA